MGASSSSNPLPTAVVNTTASAISSVIQSMPTDIMFTPNCQPKIEMENSITTIASWSTKRRAEESTMALRQISQEIVNGFGGLAHTWWHYATTEAKEGILGHKDPINQLLLALRVMFVGTSVDHDPYHYRDLFMSNQLGNINMLDAYFFQMQEWLIKGNAYLDLAFICRYIQSMPMTLPNAIMQYFRDKNISFTGMTLAEANDHIKTVIQDHCLAKRLQK